jgi:hypothetical protein
MSAPKVNDPEDAPNEPEGLTPADREAMEQAEMRGEVFARVVPRPADD